MAAKILKTLEKTTKEVITNKYVLYVLLFFAILNILGFLVTNNFISLAVFALIGVLTSYFTKNMIVVLIVTLVASNLLHLTRRTVETMANKEESKKKKHTKEGMGGSMEDDFDDAAPVKEEDSDSDNDDDHEESNHEESNHEESDHKKMMKNGKVKGKDAPPVMKNKKNGGLNHQKTVQEAYGNIHKVLGDKNFKRMTDDTSDLLDKQNKLTESLNNMAPLLQSAESMLNKFDMDKMTGMLDSLNIGAGLGKKKKN